MKLPWIPTFFHNILPVKTENKATSKVGESTICFASSSSSSLAFDLRNLLGGCGWSDTNCWPLGVNPPQHRKGVVDHLFRIISEGFYTILSFLGLQKTYPPFHGVMWLPSRISPERPHCTLHRHPAKPLGSWRGDGGFHIWGPAPSFHKPSGAVG